MTIIPWRAVINSRDSVTGEIQIAAPVVSRSGNGAGAGGIPALPGQIVTRAGPVVHPAIQPHPPG
ncbi:MAG: hypothetical protein OXD47_05795, partial [Gammaproteobacteria bacterium]|nr:hypothetical protein [Gammaproteobacteria bacterium]